MRVKNIKDFVESNNLGGYIAKKNKEWNANTYGKAVEGFIVEAAKQNGYKMTKTTPEYDYIYGADFKILFDGGYSCYCDLKITHKTDRLKDVETFLGDTFEFNATYDTKEVVQAGKGVYMCLGVKYKRTLSQGVMVYDKPVLVPIIWGDIDRDSIMRDEVANNIKLLLSIGNYQLIQQGYDKTAKRSFNFIPNEVNTKEI